MHFELSELNSLGRKDIKKQKRNMCDDEKYIQILTKFFLFTFPKVGVCLKISE